ncbi:type VI secretion protein [Hahella sp. CCB-MM4]|uniref:type VI secretion system baseplate subunit TssE n=1 Tax=Hahella sp. (strain CCB-MM4) TaxID=1926491 RepID=UPI000B9C19E2|nr:type VI secretion system baseplate subunit TssE [Hahella sp. CCB-MM4]OZG73904.1 type VI secretion protein [Hahella sp. CCB-MM4]
MAKLTQSQKLRPSILDRLMDDRPDLKTEPEKNRHQVLNELRESVRRDLEDLLNTRFRAISAPDNMHELDISLINYGLPDLHTINFLSAEGKDEFCRTIEQHIAMFEPRFKSVRVVTLDDQWSEDTSLKFRIEAILYAEPAPEEVTFDSSLEPISAIVNVQEAR